MPMEFDAPFDRWLRAHGIRRSGWREAEPQRPQSLRVRKGSVSTARTRAKSSRRVLRSSREESPNQNSFGLEARDPKGNFVACVTQSTGGWRHKRLSV